MHRKSFQPDRIRITVLLVVFASLATMYSIVVPIFEVTDELRHYPVVKHIADGNGLPVQDPTTPSTWHQEGSQPPLYYMLSALATRGINTDDFYNVWRLNPHVDSGVFKEDGNINLIVHNYDRERWPWRGTVLAVHIVRLLSVAISTAAVYFTYRIGVKIFPQRHWLAFAGTTVMAFTPMYAFISGSVNNDNLATLTATVSVWLMILIIEQCNKPGGTLRLSIMLGIVLGLAALTKLSTLGLIGLAGLTLGYAAWRQKHWQTFFVHGPLLLMLVITIAGWWYVRNLRLYGELFGTYRMVEIFGARADPVTLYQLWGERIGFLYSYWGLFGVGNVPMPLWTYTVLNALSAVSILGALVFLITRWRESEKSADWWARISLTLLWIGVVFTPLLHWSSLTQASQGRLMFSAIGALSLWFITGMTGWMPPPIGKLTASGLAAFLGVLTILAPFLWIAPQYTPPEQLDTASDPIAKFVLPGTDDAKLLLLGAEVLDDSTKPGDAVEVKLSWEVVGDMDRNWSVFIHLQDSNRLLVGQRDIYPGAGLLATSDLAVGRRWESHYIVPVHEAAYAPEALTVLVGIYDVNTGERLQVVSNGDSLVAGSVALLAREGEFPNPVNYNYGGKMSLQGYEVNNRVISPGAELDITLYWRGTDSMNTNYSVSVQLSGENGNSGGQKDSWPVNGSYPTSEWMVGDTVEDNYNVPVYDDAQPGVYDIRVIVYWINEDQEIVRLKRMLPDGRLVDEQILLTKIWIIP